MDSSPEDAAEEENSFFKLLTESSLKTSAETPEDGKTTSSDEESQKPDPSLRQGRRIPLERKSQFKPDTYACVPMEEIDPFYQNQQTFVVFSKFGRIHRFSARNSLFLLHPLNLVRKVAIYLTTNWGFSAFMIAVIISNVFLLYYKMHNAFDYICTAIYLLEFSLKILSRGLFVDKFTCLRDLWSWLDILVILTSILRPFQIPGFAVLQWTRLLKIIPLVYEMKKAFHFIVKSLRELCEPIFLGVFSILLFAILGLNSYMGVLTQKCIRNVKQSTSSVGIDEAWAIHSNEPSNWFVSSDSPDGYKFKLCGNVSHSGLCPDNYTCLQGFGKNPDHFGYTNFDSIGYALLTTTRMTLQDNIDDIFAQIVAVTGIGHLHYFILVFLFGTYAVGSFAYAVLGEYLFREIEEDFTEISDCKYVYVSNQNGTGNQCLEGEPQENNFKKSLQLIVTHTAFEVVITAAIIWDIYILFLSNHLFFPANWHRIFRFSGHFVLLVYFVEFVLKMCAYGPSVYFKKGWCIFDFIILLKFIYQLLFDDGYGIFFNPFRMFKIIPRWANLHLIFRIIVESLKYIRGFIGVFLTVWAFYALIGTEHYQMAYKNNNGGLYFSEIPRWNFVNFTHGMILIFRSWLGESIELMWDCMVISGMNCLIYFPVVGFTGLLIIMVLSVSVVFITVKLLMKKESVDSQENPSPLTTFGWICCFPFISAKAAICKGKQVGDINADDIPMKSKSKSDENPKKPEESTEVSEAKDYRRKLKDWADNRFVKAVSIFLIVITSFALTQENINLESKPTLKTVIYSMDISFTAFFAFVVLYKFMSFGPKVCCKSFAWVFDFILVLEMILHLSFNLYTPIDRMTYALFFIVRSLRPFMIVSRSERLTAVAQGIWNELGFLSGYIKSGLFIWLYFSILAYQMVGFHFGKCVNPENGSIIYGNDHKYNMSRQHECFSANFTWQMSENNFDTVPNGYVSWSLIGTQNAWTTIVYDIFDSVDTDSNYYKEIHMECTFYIIFAFFAIGILFVFSILFGVIAYQLKQEEQKGIFLSKTQFEEYEARQTTSGKTEIIPSPESGTFREKIYKLVSSNWFDGVVMIIIIISTVEGALIWYKQDATWERVLWWIRLAIIFLYLIEMILKLIGWGKYYFKSYWNCFDFLVVILALPELVLKDIIQKYFISASLLITLRIGRIFQFEPFMCRATMLRRYFKAFSLSKSALINLTVFQGVFMFSYCLFGMSLFSQVKQGKNMSSELINFQYFSSSFCVLFLLSSFSGIDWILSTVSNERDCNYPASSDPNDPGNCGSSILGHFFVFSYLIGSFLVFVNFYFVLILEIVSQIEKDNRNYLEVVEDEQVQVVEDIVEDVENEERVDPDPDTLIEDEEEEPLESVEVQNDDEPEPID